MKQRCGTIYTPNMTNPFTEYNIGDKVKITVVRNPNFYSPNNKTENIYYGIVHSFPRVSGYDTEHRMQLSPVNQKQIL